MNEWENWLDKWIYAHALLPVLSLGLMLKDGVPASRVVLGISLSVVFFVLFWKVGLPLTQHDRGRTYGTPRNCRITAWKYLVPVTVVFAALEFVDPAYFYLLFALYPCVFAMSKSSLEAVVWALLVSATSAIGMSYWGNWRIEDAAFESGGSFLFAVLFGLWITKIIDQSRDRGALISELTQTQAQLAEANHRGGIREERERMAAEIHDTLAQGYASIVMLSQGAASALHRNLENVDRPVELLGVIESTARQNLAEARALVDAMRPAGLGTGTLQDALRRLTDSHTELTSIPVSVELDDSLDLGAPQDVVLYRAAQEALNNVAKHSLAKHVLLSLRSDEASYVLDVEDDGVGMQVEPNQSGHGLFSMSKRVAHIGGTVDISSVAPNGTRVVVTVPKPDSQS